MVLVDSSVWIDYFNGRISRETDLLDTQLSRALVLTGDIILAEVLQGFRNDSDFRRAKALMEPLEFQEMLGLEVALLTATNYRKLRRKGITVRKTIDVMIASFCIRNKHTLLHADRDFSPMVRHLGLRTL